jgi:hypothetical protein
VKLRDAAAALEEAFRESGLDSLTLTLTKPEHDELCAHVRLEVYSEIPRNPPLKHVEHLEADGTSVADALSNLTFRTGLKMHSTTAIAQSLGCDVALGTR